MLLSRTTVAITEPDVSKDNIEGCWAKAQEANKKCWESESPKIKDAVATINVLLTGASQLGMADACSKYKKAMDVASLAMSAFSAQCAYFKYQCETACTASTAAINTQLAASSITPARTKQLTAEKRWAAGAIAECGSYAVQIASAGAGLVTLLKNSSQAKQCENATAKTTQQVDCNLQKNFQNVKCICERTPQAPGCAGVNSLNTGGSGTTSVSAKTTSSKKEDTSEGGIKTNVGEDRNGFAEKASLENIGGGGSGAAAGAAGGGSGSGSRSAAADGGKGKGLNPNILSGDSGGAGGGGFRSANSGGYDVPANSAYRAYMPGGEKDPSRGMASQKIEEVTGSGGEDNWKKVRERYNENRPRLGE